MLHLIQYIPSQKLMLSLCFNFADIDEVEYGNGAYHTVSLNKMKFTVFLQKLLAAHE